MAEADESIPVLRVEHSASNVAGCQHAACKKGKTKIEKGELRMGKYQYFEPGDTWITMWRHWRCVPNQQTKLLKQLAGDVAENVAGFDDISPESQQQLRLAFEHNKVADNGFTDIRTDLIKSGRGRNSADVTGYRVDTAPSGRAGCRNTACKEGKIKIAKGELRLALVTDFQGHESLAWKHWKCATADELAACKELLEQDSFDGLDLLPEEYKSVVLESIENGEAIEPPVLEELIKATKPRKPREKKAKKEDGKKDSELDETEAVDLAGDTQSTQADTKDAPEAKVQRGTKRKAEQHTDEVEDEETNVQKKRATVKVPASKTTEQVNPVEARIAALASNMRTEAAQFSTKGTGSG